MKAAAHHECKLAACLCKGVQEAAVSNGPRQTHKQQHGRMAIAAQVCGGAARRKKGRMAIATHVHSGAARIVFHG